MATRPRCYPMDFYPRSPCGERQLTAYQSGLLLDFYPRSPCGERPFSIFLPIREALFLSTLSLRRATPRGGFCYLDNIISIHALLAESDFWGSDSLSSKYISIHALLAESDIRNTPALLGNSQFLSTLSLRRATLHGRNRHNVNRISIHALLAESDRVNEDRYGQQF